MTEEATCVWMLITCGLAVGFGLIAGPGICALGAPTVVGVGAGTIVSSMICLLGSYKYFIYERKRK